VLVPRAAEQAGATADALRDRGAEAVLVPAIEIANPPQPEALLEAVDRLGSYDWVLCTSANGVTRLFAAIEQRGRDARAFLGARVGAIGPKTAASFARHGIKPDVVADEFVGEDLARAVLERGAQRVLVVRALVARDALPDALRESGATVDVVAAYQTLPGRAPERLRELLDAGRVDAVLFTSSSTVDNLCAALGDDARELLSRVSVASIGPITSKSLLAHGITPSVTASTYTVEGLLDALSAHFARA
jgi:uroporphyrinogen III methyltransferase/synthase